MCLICDNPDWTPEDYLEHMRGLVARYGWAVTSVAPSKSRAAFSYTVGLTGRGLPELLVTGLAEQVGARLLNTAAARCVQAGVPAPGELLVTGHGAPLEVVEVEHPDAHLFVAVDLFGPDVRAAQLVWPDERGRLPWDRRHRDGRAGQPVLGRRARSSAA